MSDLKKYKTPKRGQYQFDDVQLEDLRVFRLFAQGRTKGVFQLEKQLGQDWSRKVKPKSIEEIAALVALLRPGALKSGMSQLYVDRKFGRATVEYSIPELEPILGPTQGCLVYQEQAIRILSEVAKMDITDVNKLFYGLKKKKPEIVSEYKPKFMEGCAKQGIAEDKAEELFGWIEAGQRYSFNASHATGYAIPAYLTAYQKVHYPTEFYCSWLTYSDWKPSPKEEIYELVQDARMSEPPVQVLPPDIKLGNEDFTIIEPYKISYGLSHIKGVGKSSISAINKNNKRLENFAGFFSLVKTLKRNVAESLIKSGACDSYGLQRKQMLNQVQVVYGKPGTQTDPILKPLSGKELSWCGENIKQYALQDGGVDVLEMLSGLIDNSVCVKKRIPVIEEKMKFLHENRKDDPVTSAQWEKAFLGLALSCNEADGVQIDDKDLSSCRECFNSFEQKQYKVVAVIEKVVKKKTKNDDPYCVLDISDKTGELRHVKIWPKVYAGVKDDIGEGVVAKFIVKKGEWQGRPDYSVWNLDIYG